ncbi:Ubiquitin-conjugating enzyme E2 Z, partial [Trichoplax sp. H2]
MKSQRRFKRNKRIVKIRLEDGEDEESEIMDKNGNLQNLNEQDFNSEVHESAVRKLKTKITIGGKDVDDTILDYEEAIITDAEDPKAGQAVKSIYVNKVNSKGKFRFKREVREMASVGASNHNPSSSYQWDPTLDKANDEKPKHTCVLRIKRDLAAILTDPPPGMFIVPDDDDITKMHALILGPFDTPYEGGFFYFFLKFPVTYPIEPPKVKLMTTGEGL